MRFTIFLWYCPECDFCFASREQLLKHYCPNGHKMFDLGRVVSQRPLNHNEIIVTCRQMWAAEEARCADLAEHTPKETTL